MWRKWMLSAVAGLTLLTPLAFVPTAQAADRDADHHHRDWDHDRDRDHDRWRWHQHFEVMYRSCCDNPWACYGSFGERWEAERAEHFLRAQGYESFVRD